MTKKFRIYFSDFFDVQPEKIKEYGAFNISLLNDLPLFIDPFLLFNSDKPEYGDLHHKIINYVRFLKEQASKNLPSGLIKGWYHFPEVKQNWLGYSKMGNDGRGLGQKFAASLKLNLTTIFKDFGEECDVSPHLEKLTLVKNGVGKDQISDFTCNLMLGYLADFTEKFSKENIDKNKLGLFMVQRASFNWTTKTWTSKQFTLPKFGNQFVLLSPVDLLTKDEAWINHGDFVEDFSSVVAGVANDQLRNEIDQYFASVLPFEPKKDEVAKAIEKVVEKYPSLLDVFVCLKEKSGAGATALSSEKLDQANKLFVEQLRRFVDLVDSKTAFYDTGSSSFEEGLKRVNFLKDVIEKQDGYRLFYIKNKPVKREADLQIMFKLTWFASVYDMNAEVNNGRGPADFMVSYGSSDKVVIEFKLASNTQIEKNLIKQADIYTDASRATHPPIKAILYFSITEFNKVNRLLIKYGLAGKKEIVLIDAMSKASASTVGLDN